QDTEQGARTMQTETYEGWANRETWAAALQLDNYQALQRKALHKAREAMAKRAKPEDQGGPFINPEHPQDEIERQRTEWTRKTAGDALQRFIEGMAEDTFDAACSAISVQRREYAEVIQAIGSLWRVDWRELADHFIAKAAEIDNE
ncbi:MAG: hypothetical protein ACLFV8_12690, partial [Alphaproteobacteria bacterium]